MALIPKGSDEKYLSPLSDGALHMSVPEGTEGAIRREYETSDKKTGVKFELIYKEVSGMISKIAFHEGDYGKNLLITLVDGEDAPITLSIPTYGGFGEDIMKKLPNVVTGIPVSIAPYAFVDDKGKSRKGITLKQNDVKINNFYYDVETKKNINGYPETGFPAKKKPSKDDWKMYFMQVRKFLEEQICEKFGINDIETAEEKAQKDYDAA